MTQRRHLLIESTACRVMSVESDGFHSPRSHTLVHNLSNLSTISEPPEPPARPPEIQPASPPEQESLPFLDRHRPVQVCLVCSTTSPGGVQCLGS